MKRNTIGSRLKKSALLFISLGLNIVSLFLPWYKHSITLQNHAYECIFMPFQSWITPTSDSYTLVNQVPDLHNIEIFFYLQLVFSAALVVLSILLIFNINDRAESKSWFQGLKYLYSIICVLLLMVFPVFIIMGDMFYPYLRVLHASDESVSIHVYSVAFGYVLGLFSSILQLFMHARSIADTYSPGTGLNQIHISRYDGYGTAGTGSIRADIMEDTVGMTRRTEEDVAHTLNVRLEEEFS